MKCNHLLIDAKNMLYRAIFTARSDKRFTRLGHHPINIVLHFLTFYLERFQPDEIHIFWDSRRDSTWRRNIYPEYKLNRNGKHDIGDDLINLTEVCISMFKNMGIHQYYKETMEADDLIYAFCKIDRSSQIIIVSSDSDLKQIPYNFSNVKIHHPLVKDRMFEEIPQTDPVMHKCLVGDKSDNISGYYLIGDIKAALLVENRHKQKEFFESDKTVTQKEGSPVGIKRLIDNYKLIDLSLCPYVLDNMEYILSRQFKPVKFNLKKIKDLISKYKLKGVTSSISRYVSPFKKLTEEPDGSRNSLR
jgi:DNA polymerase I